MKNVFLVMLMFLSAQMNASDQPRIVYWNPDNSSSTVIYMDGVARERLIDNGRVIDVWPPRQRDKHSLEVLVGIQNKSNNAIDVDPSVMGGLSTDSPPIQMHAIDADVKLAKEERSASRWARIGAGFSGFAAGYGPDATGRVTNSDGSSSTVTIRDGSGVRNAQRESADNRKAIAAKISRESSQVLRRNTVFPGNFVIGNVYVDHPKGMPSKSEMGSFLVDLGDTIYVFRFVSEKVPVR